MAVLFSPSCVPSSLTDPTGPFAFNAAAAGDALRFFPLPEFELDRRACYTVSLRSRHCFKFRLRSLPSPRVGLELLRGCRGVRR